MSHENLFLDIAHHSLNKRSETLCGDKVQVFKSEDRTMIVLADGLGSGVKANILATLTSQIVISMLKMHAGIHDVVDTIMHTLPVCKLRGIAYSTFTIVEIDRELNCQIYEYDNPAFILIRGGELKQPLKQVQSVSGKDVLVSRFKMQEADQLCLCSDGVVHAGVGTYLSFGWEWDNVAKFVKNLDEITAFEVCHKLIDICRSLYDGCPDDDTTVVALKIRRRQDLQVFTGPPANPLLDKPFVAFFKQLGGRKMIGGGTAAQIYARCTGQKVKADLFYADASVPMTASIQGIDLVTEGVITMSKCTELLRQYKRNHRSIDLTLKDGATRMMRLFLMESTCVNFWFGKAVNSAHQTPDFPASLSRKIDIVTDLMEALRALGVDASIRYISEIKYERV